MDSARFANGRAATGHRKCVLKRAEISRVRANAIADKRQVGVRETVPGREVVRAGWNGAGHGGPHGPLAGFRNGSARLRWTAKGLFGTPYWQAWRSGAGREYLRHEPMVSHRLEMGERERGLVAGGEVGQWAWVPYVTTSCAAFPHGCMMRSDA